MLNFSSSNKLAGLHFLAKAAYNKYRYNPTSKSIISPYIQKANMGDGLLTPGFIKKEIEELLRQANDCFIASLFTEVRILC